ncbi:tryptophan synthase subunit alpha [Candidatus Omnitrophota bacterium]
MNRIDKKFNELKREKKKAFIAYICAGDPDIDITKTLVLELDKAGVDIIELGVPFSDPLADGPTIQRASQRALKRKITIADILSLVKSLRGMTDIPLILMTYYNPVHYYGVKKFVKDAKASGVDGVIIPDLIPEEADELISVSRPLDFSTIFLAAPTSSKERIKLIAKKSRGFIYYVSLTGVTGARKSLPEDVRAHVKEIKKITDKPICIGFGVSSPKQIRELAKFSDGVIVGSAIISKIENLLNNRSLITKNVAKYVKSLLKGLE